MMFINRHPYLQEAHQRLCTAFEHFPMPGTILGVRSQPMIHIQSVLAQQTEQKNGEKLLLIDEMLHTETQR